MFVQLREYPGYCVTDEGQIISLKSGRWKELKTSFSNYGYVIVSFSQYGKNQHKRVHRLVMEAFHGPSELEVNHKNGDKTDNRLENLEYCTHSQNIQHAWDMGLKVTTQSQREAVSIASQGERNHGSKLTDQQVIDLLALKGAMLQKEAAQMFGISQAQVHRIWVGKKWKHLQRNTPII
jgi:hypothetical protein